MRNSTKAALLGAALALGALGASTTSAQSPFTNGAVRIAVMNDQSGVYSQLSGANSVKAAQMAAEDFLAQNPRFGAKVEILSVDHQNKPDVANAKALELFDRQGADMIVDLPTSSTALAVANVANQKKKIAIVVTGGTTALTNANCNKYTFHYAYDNYMLANGTGSAVAKAGGKSWYMIYPNYAFGQDLERQMRAAVLENGGKIVAPSDATPFPNDDFSSYLLKAQSLKPQVFGTMQAGADLVNVVKQFNEFGLKKAGITLAIGLLFDTDIAALGADAFAGAVITTPWFWNLDERSRAWAQRFQQVTKVKPTFAHAGVYSATMQYLKAVAKAGTDDADKTVAALDGSRFTDFFARNATIRPQDHRVILDAYQVRVKPAAQVKEPGDYYELIGRIPAAQAFMPLSESTCKMAP